MIWYVFFCLALAFRITLWSIWYVLFIYMFFSAQASQSNQPKKEKQWNIINIKVNNLQMHAGCKSDAGMFTCCPSPAFLHFASQSILQILYNACRFQTKQRVTILSRYIRNKGRGRKDDFTQNSSLQTSWFVNIKTKNEGILS